MRLFLFRTEPLFLGNKDCTREINYAKSALDRAFTLLGGIQQLPSIHEDAKAWEAFEQSIPETEEEIRDIIRDIATLLTGREIDFK